MSDYSKLSDILQTVEWNDDVDDSERWLTWLMPNNSSIQVYVILCVWFQNENHSTPTAMSNIAC